MKLKTVTKVPVHLKGKSVRVSIDIYGRGGTSSPEMHIITYQGKRYTPYAQKLKGFEYISSTLLALLYSGKDLNAIVNFTTKPNPFFEVLKTINDASGKYYPIPVVYGKSEE